MTGHMINESVAWADAEFEGISIDYDDVTISLTEARAAKEKSIRCRGYIGFELKGFWDEVVIESVQVVEDHEFLLTCQKELNRRYPKGAPDTGQSLERACC